MIKPLEYAESILRSNPLNAYDIATSSEYQLLDNMVVYLDALYIEVNALWLMSRFEEAISRSNDLLTLAIDQKNDLGQGRAHNTLGNVYSDLSNIDKALEHYVKGLAHSRTANDYRNEAAILNNLGDIYLTLEDYEEALKYYRKSMLISVNITDRSTYGVSKLNIAEMHYKKQEYDQAFDYSQESLTYFMEREDYFSIAYSHFLLARIYRQKQENEEAINHLSLAIDIMRRLQDHYNLSLAYLEMINTLVESSKYDDALEYIEDALDIADRMSLNKEKAEIALHAAQTYEQLTYFDKALDAYKMYVAARFLYEKEQEEEHLRNIKAQMNIENTMHEKEIYRLKNVELKRKSDEIEKLYEDMKTITNIGQNITSTLDISRIMLNLYDNIIKLMDAQTFGIYLYQPDRRLIERNLLLFEGKPIQRDPISLDCGHSLSAWAISKKQALMINCLEEIPDEVMTNRLNLPESQRSRVLDKSETSTIVVPLIMEVDVIGCIVVKSNSKHAYSDYQFNLIKALASYITIAVINSQESQMLSEEIKMRIEVQKSLETLNKQLSEMSYKDALTDIPNRRSFVEFFTRELIRCARSKEQLALFIIDIDHFKEFNDNYGHVNGDRCLTQVAGILRSTLKRKVDFVARYGGDEFVVVLNDVDYQGAKKLVEDMKENVKAAGIAHTYSPVAPIVTLTIGGILLVPEDGVPMETVVAQADTALYKAKEMGRNQICFENQG